MKKNSIVFGLIAGAIVSVLMSYGVFRCYNSMDFDTSMVIGYASMLIAFSFVFVGIKNYRDKHNGGIISFGKAFRAGLWITMIASTMYVLTWMVVYYNFMPDFLDRYAEHMTAKAQESGATSAEMQSKMAEMETAKEMYKNPVFVALFTYVEILPVGLLVTLISALILKRKDNKPAETAMA